MPTSVVGYSTAGALISRVSVQVGLGAQADPYSSTDANVVRLVEALTTAGEELSQHIKAHAEKVHTFTTAASALSYDLPADFLEPLDGTAFNRSANSPLHGPISATTEQALVSAAFTSSIAVPFRIQGNRLTFPVDPGDGLSMALKYVSSYWVQSASPGDPDKTAPTANGDYILFDPGLVVRALKYRYLTDTGLDNSVAFVEFKDRLAYATGKASGARVLSMTGTREGFTFISGLNLPNSGA